LLNLLLNQKLPARLATPQNFCVQERKTKPEMGSQVSRGIKVELVEKRGKQPAVNVDSPIRRDMPGGYTISKDVSGNPNPGRVT